MKSIVVATVASVLALVVAAPSEAAESGWTLRIQGGLLTSSADLVEEEAGATLRAQAETSPAFSVGLEYRLADRIGIEVSALYSDIDIDFSAELGSVRAEQTVKLEMTPLTLGFNIHLTPSSRFDFYVTPSVSYVRYGDVAFRVDEIGLDDRNEVDSDSTAFGLSLGVDIPLGSSAWSVSAHARKIWTNVEDVELDPTLVMVGFARRF